MSWARVAVALVLPLCQASSVSDHRIEHEVKSHGQVVDVSKSGIVRSQSDEEPAHSVEATPLRAEEITQPAAVRPHLPDHVRAALTETDEHDTTMKTVDEVLENRQQLSRAAAAQRGRSSISKMVAERSSRRTNHSMHGRQGGDGDKVDLGWAPCSWQKPTTDDTLHCGDGTYCNPKTEQWTCCATHGGRLQCPKFLPYMCNAKYCGGNDYCCAGWCEYYDGDKPCSIKHKIYGIDQGWLTCNTRDGSGNELPEWKDLYANPMTWEVWYSRRPQSADYNTDRANAVMATYADNHNTETYTTHNRRRNIGVYIEDGKLLMASFIGDGVKEVPSYQDIWGGASVVLGPQITDENWHHIAAVWDRAAGKGWLYLDGQKHSQPVTYEPGDENPGEEGKLVIGGGHLGRTTTAQVSQFRMWKVAFTEDQVKALMTCGEPDLPATDLKAFYRLSGDLDNSVKSGFESLIWEQSQGVFANGEPCVPGMHGLKGKDAWGGKDGLIGIMGVQGDPGPPYIKPGPPGPKGRRGEKGPPGPPAPTPGMLGTAYMKDLYVVGGVCVSIWILAVGLIYFQFIHEKKKPAAAASTEGEWEEEW